MTQIELDDYDIGILAYLSDHPNSTTSDIAKALFHPPFNLRKLDCFIRYRLDRFLGEDIIKCSGTRGKKHYDVDRKKVHFGEGIIRMNGVSEIDMGFFIVVRKKNETIAKSIDDYERRLQRSFMNKE